MRMQPDLEVYPLTPERWDNLERLFGKRGACGGCWCMWWRLTRSQYQKQRGAGNRKAFKRIVDSGEVPGLLAYRNGQPVGWCAVAPREKLTALERSRTLKRVDDRPVWSVVCFYVARPHRRQGVSQEMLLAAREFASRQGATILEGYPVEPVKNLPDAFAWTGMASAFREAGFTEVLRRSARRPIMRCALGPQRAKPENCS